MKVAEFLKKYRTTKREEKICVSVYKETDKTEEQWKVELSDKIVYAEPKKVEPKVEKVVLTPKQKIEEKMNNKQSKS